MSGLSSFISCACEADRSLRKRCLMAAMCRLMASLLGLMMVLNPSGFPCLLLPVWVLPTGNWRMVKPKKSKVFGFPKAWAARLLAANPTSPLEAESSPVVWGGAVYFGDQGSSIAGLVDTIENPCCCKLLVDLEWLAIKNGVIGQTPTLPVF